MSRRRKRPSLTGAPLIWRALYAGLRQGWPLAESAPSRSLKSGASFRKIKMSIKTRYQLDAELTISASKHRDAAPTKRAEGATGVCRRMPKQPAARAEIVWYANTLRFGGIEPCSEAACGSRFGGCAFIKLDTSRHEGWRDACRKASREDAGRGNGSHSVASDTHRESADGIIIAYRRNHQLSKWPFAPQIDGLSSTITASRRAMHHDCRQSQLAAY